VNDAAMKGKLLCSQAINTSAMTAAYLQQKLFSMATGLGGIF